jgi:hypothetical protein
MPKPSSLGREMIAGMEEVLRVLKSGEPLEDHFRVTTLYKADDGRVFRVRHPGPEKGAK